MRSPVFLLLFLIGSVTATTAPLAAQVGSEGAKPQPDYRVERALKELELDYTLDEDNDFKLLYEVAGDPPVEAGGKKEERTQLVYVFSNTERYGKLEIREVWAPVMVADSLSAEVANRLLEANERVKLGAFRSSQLTSGKNSGKVMVSYAAHVSADADAETLRLAVEMVFSQADEMEAELTQTDAF